MIRKANKDDIPQLSALFNAYRLFYRKEEDLEGAVRFLQERINNHESVIFVSDNQGKLSGFTQLYPQFSSTRMQKIWLLNDLFVDPAHRGKGISRALIEAAKQLARQTNAAGLLLETEKTNSIGNKLYPSAGFSLYNATNFYWWDNVTAVSETAS